MEVRLDAQTVKVENYKGIFSLALADSGTFLTLNNLQKDETDAMPLGYNVYIPELNENSLL